MCGKCDVSTYQSPPHPQTSSSSTHPTTHGRRSLTFLEFLEALGRVADLVSPPTVADLVACGFTSHIPTAEYYRHGMEQFSYLPDRCTGQGTEASCVCVECGGRSWLGAACWRGGGQFSYLPDRCRGG